ncbi:LysR family transcriptional regulator [Spongiibacter sp. KMU-158]|uniref:LysR family transcriptional regulator n=1 Tax=Spongiibacter pelagi TaxID=2760804 RepID=A0A927C2L2_9GAMM|nr:LysR family transcriptional regulator [Spongiibacter pelagi]MBD2859614.1 LysR family transcriptional regulator [Spongiibacter pelagi]
MSKVDLNLFAVFNAIYSQHNLTRAAEILHVSQPAVSNALARLRDLFDDPLFVRSPGGVSPTPLARQLINPVRQALETLDDCVKARLDFDPATSNETIRLHAAEQASALLLPKLLPKLIEQAPHLRLEIQFQNRRDVPLALAAGDLQLGIDAPLLSSNELLSQPLAQEDYVCVMRRDHPLSKQPISLEDFLAAPHIQVSSRARGATPIDIALRSLGQQREIALRIPHYSLLPQVIASTDYLAAVPRIMVSGWQLHHCPLPFPVPPLEMHLFWHKNSDHDPLNQWLRELITNLLKI